MRIVIGCDHAGYDMKEQVKQYLVSKDYNIIDVGTDSDKSVDYPYYGHEIGKKVAEIIKYLKSKIPSWLKRYAITSIKKNLKNVTDFINGINLSYSYPSIYKCFRRQYYLIACDVDYQILQEKKTFVYQLE